MRMQHADAVWQQVLTPIVARVAVKSSHPTSRLHKGHLGCPMTTSSNKLCGTDAHLVELSRGNRGEKKQQKNNTHHSAGTPPKFDGSSPCSLHFTCHLLLVSSSIIHFRTQMCSQSHMVVLPLRFHHPHGRWHKAPPRAPPPAPRRQNALGRLCAGVPTNHSMGSGEIFTKRVWSCEMVWLPLKMGVFLRGAQQFEWLVVSTHPLGQDYVTVASIGVPQPPTRTILSKSIIHVTCCRETAATWLSSDSWCRSLPALLRRLPLDVKGSVHSTLERLQRGRRLRPQAPDRVSALAAQHRSDV